MAQIIWGTTTKPASATRLAEALARPEIDGLLYIGYPVLGTPDGAFPIDALLLSPSLGAVIFDIVEGREAGDFEARQDNIFAKVQAKLFQYPALVRRRELQPKVTIATFAPAAANAASSEEYPVLTEASLLPFVQNIVWADTATYPALAAAIQAISNIRRSRKRREAARSDSRGAKLIRLNDSIANLDVDQSVAVVETVEGVQRIRGLAGSGKTIVLALKVAYLHAQHPEWKIAVTFNTRSLKGQFERLINSFVFEQTNEEPDWGQIDILQAWGSPSNPGVYYNFCRANGLAYHDFDSAKRTFGENKEFAGACQQAIESRQVVEPSYDAVLVDEAQDLPPPFLKLCWLTLRDVKRLVYAYDELQSLTNASLPPPEELFGNDIQGQPLVQFHADVPGQPRQDIILERCYRNSRPILTTAHSLGFGIYRQPGGLIQIFDQPQLWHDVGYRVADGELADDRRVRLVRTPETSPSFLEAHSLIDDLIQFRRFVSAEEQDAWLVAEILRNLREDELTPEDIVVINPDPLKTRKAVSAAREALFKEGVNSSLAGVSSSPDIFFEPDVVTFSGIFRAKGNEAAMVYVINAHDCFDAFLPAWLTRTRSQLFTAITRAKAWVRVLGVGPKMDGLAAEYDRIRQHEFALDFTYPNARRRQEMRVVNRDMTRAERGRVSKKVTDLSGVLQALEEGDVRPEDLPNEMRQKLRDLFS